MPQELTPHLTLPLMQPAQAQKHVTHNEALLKLDALLGLTLQAMGQDEPPESPELGQVWGLGAAPTGAWQGKADQLAMKLEEAWLFISPPEGLLAWDRAGGRLLLRAEGEWVAPPLSGLDALGIGTGSDSYNVLSVAGAASLLTHAGQGHQLKINKAAVGQTASLLFQTDWSGRAEIGLAGSDALTFKVSEDGTTWREAMSVHPASGKVGFGAGASLPYGSAAQPSLALAEGVGIFRTSSGEIGFSHEGSAVASLGEALTLEVPLQGSALVQSASDATLGRLVTPGWMGLGLQGEASRVLDLDSLTIPSGLWRFGGSGSTGTLPAPITPEALCYLRIERLAASEVSQTLWASNGGSGTWQRVAVAGVWGGWRLIAPKQLLGEVGQTAGTPTGALIESGTTANGRYTRFADGTQICSAEGLSMTQLDSGQMGLSWTYPRPFAHVPSGGHSLPPSMAGFSNLTPDTLGAGFWSAELNSVTLGHFKAYGAPSFAVNAGVSGLCVWALGRWF